MLTLQQSDLAITVAAKGAELTAITDQRDGTEYLWSADPTYWGRHAPVLFPIVGRLKDNQYHLQGKVYEMGQHGFARDHVFELHQEGDQQIRCTLNANEETLARFPFHFRLDIAYTLRGRTVEVAYAITNEDEKTMPFSIGAHPAFRCPLVAGETFSDYDLIWAIPEQTPRHLLAGGLYTGETEPLLLDQTHLPLTEELFERDALVFHDLQSDWVEMRSRISGKGVRISLTGFPYLGIWTKPGAPFVCLEPWQGLADYTSATGDLHEKVGIHLLMSGQVHHAAYQMMFG